ncbi:MAG: ABC transporter permease subunit [Turneriella sp.]|nr:ABC transporter permease subunit [Leptospiraceae bacterium]MCX7631710.1 ABC transporter permease subunit [Turneriella sp.]
MKRVLSFIPPLLLAGLLVAGLFAEKPTIALEKAFAPPGKDFIFGSTPLGQSVLLLALHGAGSSLTMAFTALTVALGVALALTGVVFLLPQAVQNAYARLMDSWLAIPGFFIALSLGFFLPQSPYSVMAALAISEFAPLEKFLLGRLGSIARAEYVTMASILGAPPRHKLGLHIMPQLAREAGYLFGVSLPGVVLSLASLEFLGVQTGSELPSLGLQIAIYKDYIWLYPQLSLVPVVMLLVLLSCVYATGQLLRRVA